MYQFSSKPFYTLLIEVPVGCYSYSINNIISDFALFSAIREKKDDEKNKQNSSKGTIPIKIHASSTDIAKSLKTH